MRAAVLHAFREPLSLEEVPEPRLPADGALVEVRATGLCRSDWHGWMGHDDSIASPTCPGTSSRAWSRRSARRCAGSGRATA